MQLPSENGHIEVVQALIEKGADFEAKNKFGDDPLILGMFILNYVFN